MSLSDLRTIASYPATRGLYGVTTLLTFGQFVDRLRVHLRLDLPDTVRRDDSLYEQLGLDSIQAFELMVVTEASAGSVIPPATFPELYSVGDAYAYYKERRALGSSQDWP